MRGETKQHTKREAATRGIRGPYDQLCTPKNMWRIVASLILSLTIIPCAVISHAGEVNSIIVRGKTITINNTADQVFAVLKGRDVVNQTMKRDPNNPNSLLVVKTYRVKAIKFTVYFARVQDPGHTR